MEDEQQAATTSFIPAWRQALGDETAFDRLVPRHVRLEGSIFQAPINGREKVWAAVHAAGGITDALRFTHELASADRCYLEWELEALGLRLNGVSVIRFDSSRLIDRVSFHHRPLGGVLAFSAEMGRRLGDSVGRDMFLPSPAEQLIGRVRPAAGTDA
jgi:hypothetical protein